MRNKKQRNRLFTSLVASMVALSALSQTNGGTPKLVLGIVVDQLRSDYINLLQERFGETGFNRLIKNGAYFENVDFNCANIDVASGTAMVVSGTYPKYNGISQSKVFDAQKKVAVPILNDANYLGNFTTETFSPKALKVSTISDELKVNNDGLGSVFSFAPDAQQAIIMAGHAANGAFWINDADGKWSTTTYYKDVPNCVQNRNYNTPLIARLDTLSWSPAMLMAQYIDIPDAYRFNRFHYSFGKNVLNRFTNYKNSGMVNEEVTSVAIECINSLNLGRRGLLDMVNVGYSAAPYEYSTNADNRLELQDTYVRLDAQLGRLLTAVDKQVGLENTVIYLTSTGHFNEQFIPDGRYNIPSGEFYPERAVSLLNIYLIALYGNGQWVDSYYDRAIFLNRNLIKEKNLDLSAIRAKACEFLRQMSGVYAVYSFEEILNNPVTEDLSDLNHSMIPSNQGDLVLDVMPGWTIVEKVNTKQEKTIVRHNAVSTPAIIFAPQAVKPQRIGEATDVRFIAPTISRILRIRSPNAAAFMPLILR